MVLIMELHPKWATKTQELRSWQQLQPVAVFLNVFFPADKKFYECVKCLKNIKWKKVKHLDDNTSNMDTS